MKTKSILALCAMCAVSAYAGPSGYHLVKTIKVGGVGGWDYLTADNANHRLYVSHGTKVEVIDLQSGEKTAEIPDTPGVHGIALAPKLGLGFISCGRANHVKVFDMKTLAEKGIIETGKNPDSIMYDEASNRVFAFNGGSASATAIDATTLKVVGTVPLGGKPETPATDGKGRIWVNIEDKSSVVQFDSKTLKVLNTWPVAPCEEPSGIAMDTKNMRLFLGCGNKLMAVVDANNGKVLTTLPIGDGVDANGFDPASNDAFASTSDGHLAVVHEDSPTKFTLVENVPTQDGCRTMTVDPVSHIVYLPATKYGAPVAGKKGRSMVPGTFEVLAFGK